MLHKVNELLFRVNKNKKIKLIDVRATTNGPAGIHSSCRPTDSSTKNAPAKYSSLGLILDEIFVDHKVSMKQGDDVVYTKFEHDGKIYEGVYNGERISWVTPEPDDYMVLVPTLAWVLSDNFTGDDASEIKGYFKDIKENTSDPEILKTSVLLLCDAYYYAYAKKDENAQLTSLGNEIPKETIEEGLKNGVYTDIPVMSGIPVDISGVAASDDSDEDIEPEEEESFLVQYDGWDEEQRKNIPPQSTLNGYVMTDATLSIARKIKYRMDKVLDRMNSGLTGNDAIGPDYVNILMVGRPGTGKTALANAVAAMTGMPIYEIPFSKHTEEDTAEGKNKVVKGKVDFVETDLLKAFEHGGIIVMEEINLADPGVVMGSLGQAIEKPFIIMKDGYQPVHRHPLCVVIGTMNTGTAGSRQLNQALSSRFKCTYILDDPSRDTFINILTAQGYAKKNCRYVYDAYRKVISWLKSPEQSQEDLCENITMRGCFGALECMEEGQTGKEALKNSIVGKIAEVDLEVARQVEDKVIANLPDRL